MPAADCDWRSLRICGSLTMEEPATVAMPRVLERARVRHCVFEKSISRMRDL